MPEFPQVFVFREGDEAAAAEEIRAILAGVGIERPFVLTSRHGEALAARLEGAKERAQADTDVHGAAALGSRIKRAGADAVVAIGGGRTLDIGKLAAARAGLAVIAVPTQLSHDGLCSPVAVIPGEDGRTRSLGAIAPRVVFVSLPTLMSAPMESLRAGVGDLLANPLALRDWALAADHGLDEVDQRAWDLSVRSHDLIAPHLERDLGDAGRDPEFLHRLADALVCSGMAMICAGTSRPASGGEHEISHAIDHLYGGRAMHGAQVAFGCIFSVALYGEDVAAFRERLRALGLPQHPADLGLTPRDVARILLEAPDTRPGRYTILEETDLDEQGAQRLVERIWSD